VVTDAAGATRNWRLPQSPISPLRRGRCWSRWRPMAAMDRPTRRGRWSAQRRISAPEIWDSTLPQRWRATTVTPSSMPWATCCRPGSTHTNVNDLALVVVV